MRDVKKPTVLLVAFVMLVVGLFSPVGDAFAQAIATATSTSVSPDAIKLFFNVNAILLAFVWGLLVKYAPFLKWLPNKLIPWTNLIGFILAFFAVPEAHAGIRGSLTGIPDAVGCIIGGFTSSIWARQLYEGFGRSLLEGIFGRKEHFVR